MANQAQLALLKQGVEIWNQWREKYPVEKIDLQDANLQEANLQKANLRGANLHGADLRGAPFLHGADLGAADLQDADLQDADLQDADLRGANLRGANLKHADLQGANLRGANLRGANLQGANLQGANFGDADLGGADLQRVDLRHANLQRANLKHANLQGANLQGANLLHGANLQGANLQTADLQDADLRRANLRVANLRVANLQIANLQGADLEDANLQFANLQRADLRGANLRGADLRFANLADAKLSGAWLYACAKDQWIIDAVRCDYVFWDGSLSFEADEEKQQWEAEHRFPKDRDFRPGEFEELYKHQPTFEYYFQQGFTPIDAILMDQIVQIIDTRYPEFHLKLVSLDSRGQPHAVFTVQQPEHIEMAKSQVTTDYEQRLAALEGQQAQFMKMFAMVSSGRVALQEVDRGMNLRQLLPLDLTQQLVAFLVTLPDIHDRLKQQAFLLSAGLDTALFHQLHIGEPPTSFINALISNCMTYGQLNDGRHALIAVMNAARQLVGKNRQADADALIQQIEAQMRL